MNIPQVYSINLVNIYRGIPYALPPVGKLRWEEPVETGDKWTNELDATKFGSFCPQWNFDVNKVVGDEDCLFLNVYTPLLKTGRKIYNNFINPPLNTCFLVKQPDNDRVIFHDIWFHYDE